MADCDACVHERNISQAANQAERLARIEEQLKAVRHDIADMVCTQIKDHGKRIAALERRALWAAGWAAGAACAASALTAVVLHFLNLGGRP